MNIISDFIPKDTNKPYYRRPGILIPAIKYITIHNTGNPSSTAKNERGWLTNPTNIRQASFHIVIDQLDVIECIPTGLTSIFPKTTKCEVAWHAGDGNGSGNRESIGIEICESGDYHKTCLNAIKIVASILQITNLTIDKVRQHFNWSGKDCPRIFRHTGTWQTFLNDIQTELTRLKTPVQQQPITKPPIVALEEWQKQMGLLALDYLNKNGLLNNPNEWNSKLGDTTQNWLSFVMYKRLHEKITTEIETMKKQLNL